MQHLGSNVAALRALAAKEKQGRNSERAKPLRFEDVVADTPQFTMNRMSRGEAAAPAWPGLQGSKLMGW
jgi:hypothetical protein